MNEQLKTWLDDDANHEAVRDDYFHNWGSPEAPEGWTSESVDSYGGEDQGSDYWSVWRFVHTESGEEVLVKFYGWYQSFVGSEFEGFKQVFAKEKTITVYE